MSTSIPSYEPMLSAFHRAYANELRVVVGGLPLRKGQKVLDLACGDGAYTPWLSEAVGPRGQVVAVDGNPAYLELAREASLGRSNVQFLCSTVENLPIESEFDLCWCAQSLYSLPEPVETLRDIASVTKPGGTVAILECDSLHHIVLPWPPEVELAVLAAELRALADESRNPRKFYVGRLLRGVFREAGLEDVNVRTVACDRAAPLGPDETAFFTEHLKNLTGRVADDLDASARRKFERMVDPGSDAFLLRDPDLTATVILQVATGRRR